MTQKKSDKSRCDEAIDLEEAIAAAKGEPASITGLTQSPAVHKPSADGIAVMGSHPQTVQQAPWDQNWLFYACSPHNLVFEAQNGRNPNLRYLPGGVRADGGRFRVDEWFEVHLPLADKTRPYGYLRELEKLPLVWVRDKEGLARIKGARPYPEKEMKDRFGPFTFTSSIAFILAKAIVDAERMKIPRIGIWGVMQASQNEYAYQRPGIQNLIWEATKLGIEVLCPQESKLFEPQPENF